MTKANEWNALPKIQRMKDIGQADVGRCQSLKTVFFDRCQSIGFLPIGLIPGVNWGRCRQWSADFEASSSQLGLMRFFGVLRTEKEYKFSNILGVRQRCARSDERRQSSSDRCTQKVLKAMFDILIVSFLFECQRFCFSWSWVVWGLLKPIEPVKNAGNTHSKKSLALLLRVRLCSFCFNQLICTFEAIVNICHELMSRRQGCDSEISAQHAFSIFFYWIWAHMFTLLLWRLQVFCTWSNVEVLLGCVPRVETYS